MSQLQYIAPHLDSIVTAPVLGVERVRVDGHGQRLLHLGHFVGIEVGEAARQLLRKVRVGLRSPHLTRHKTKDTPSTPNVHIPGRRIESNVGDRPSRTSRRGGGGGSGVKRVHVHNTKAVNTCSRIILRQKHNKCKSRDAVPVTGTYIRTIVDTLPDKENRTHRNILLCMEEMYHTSYQANINPDIPTTTPSK